MKILKNIVGFITEPKNNRLMLFAALAVLILFLLHKCNQTKDLNNQLELAKQEAQRVNNNYEAKIDSIKQYQVDDNTWRAEKRGYELTIDELKGEYSSLLGDFEIEKNRPPKFIIKTEYQIKEVINNVLVYAGTDGAGNTFLKFADSAKYDNINYRYLTGQIPYKLIFNSSDSSYNIIPGLGTFGLQQGMGLNAGLFQDKKTKKVYIKIDTDYPGITFTNIEGASIMDDPKNKKALRSMRKNWAIGFNIGYGVQVNTSSSALDFGPYMGIGLSYSPKFLQFGK